MVKMSDHTRKCSNKQRNTNIHPPVIQKTHIHFSLQYLKVLLWNIVTFNILLAFSKDIIEYMNITGERIAVILSC